MRNNSIRVDYFARLFAVLLAVSLLCSSAIIRVEAASGDLDPTFGTGGKVMTSFVPPGFEQATAVVEQPDGKLVVAGLVNDVNFSTVLGVARYNADGSLDPAFGSGGRVTLATLFNYGSTKVDVALQADGKIVMVSAVGPLGTLPDFGVVRLNADGSIDNGFGTNGVVTTDFFGQTDLANAVAIQPDGKIVVAGATYGPNWIDFAIARYDATGTPDSSFGTGGKVTTDFFASEDIINGIALQADGKIVAVGNARPDFSSKTNFALARYTTAGVLDSTFDGDGLVTTDISPSDLGASVVIQPGDGKIIVGGSSLLPNSIGITYDFAILRYQTDGALDPSFGNNGLAATDFRGAGDTGRSVKLQSDGKIVAGGFVQDPADVENLVDFGLARFNTGGTIDASFGAGGKVITDFGGLDNAEALAVTANCKIVAVGWTWQVELGDIDFALARYDSDGCAEVGGGSKCPLSQGHWKNNPSLWPVDSLTLGNVTYSKSELLGILVNKTTGDASLILAQQLIAAKLNILNGSDPAPVSSTIAHADSLLSGFSGKLPYKVKSSSSVGAEMTADGALLNSYNNGLLTPNCNP